ncbi:hypothetical protein CEXT_190621 [Caerostris extrusa]|uniref:Uncharacterized protein n=1 Tax=Caerostris extrusa TaxID=172846 RepID=A0AAV4MGC1_CAEEX|nr:hypothetical protein CEXT_190621 [Caerostris extrusa]
MEVVFDAHGMSDVALNGRFRMETVFCSVLALAVGSLDVEWGSASSAPVNTRRHKILYLVEMKPDNKTLFFFIVGARSQVAQPGRDFGFRAT